MATESTDFVLVNIVIASLIYSSVLESRSEDATFNSRTGQTKPRHDGGARVRLLGIKIPDA